MRDDLTRPPHCAVRLLSALLGTGEWAESVLGDLHEEYVVLASRSVARARRWYWLEALRLGARGGGRRIARVLQSRSYAPAAPPAPRGDSLMRTIGLEIRHAFRALVQRPSLSAIVVITLALGLGANAAVFSMIDALVLRPFTMRDVDRITMVTYGRQDDINRRESVSPADFVDLKKQADVFERSRGVRLVGREPGRTRRAGEGAGLPRLRRLLPRARSRAVDWTRLPGRRRADRPRAAGDSRARSVAAPVCRRSSDCRQQRRDRRRQLRGRRHRAGGLRLSDGRPSSGPRWRSTRTTAANRRSLYLTVVGRLAPDRTLDDAKAQVAVIGERLEREHPETNRGRAARVYTLGDGMMDLGVGPLLSMWQASSPVSSCSSPAPTSRTCCSRAAPSGSARWRCGSRWAPAARAWFASC